MTLSIVAEVQAEAGDIDDALETVQSIEDATERTWAMSTIAAAQADDGDIDGAR